MLLKNAWTQKLRVAKKRNNISIKYSKELSHKMISRSCKNLVTTLKSQRIWRQESTLSCRAWFTTSLETTCCRRPWLWSATSHCEGRSWQWSSPCRPPWCRSSTARKSSPSSRRHTPKFSEAPLARTSTWSRKAPASLLTTWAPTSLKAPTTRCTLTKNTNKSTWRTWWVELGYKNNILSNKTQQCKIKCKTNMKTLNSIWTAPHSSHRSPTISRRATKKTIQWECPGSSSRPRTTPWVPSDL